MGGMANISCTHIQRISGTPAKWEECTLPFPLILPNWRKYLPTPLILQNRWESRKFSPPHETWAQRPPLDQMLQPPRNCVHAPFLILTYYSQFISTSPNKGRFACVKYFLININGEKIRQSIGLWIQKLFLPVLRVLLIMWSINILAVEWLSSHPWTSFYIVHWA